MHDGFELTLHGLLRKRAMTFAEVDGLRDQIATKMVELDHLDATIRIFHPAISADDLPEKRPAPPSAAFRGEVQRFLLNLLRTAQRPMTTFDLARAVMDNRRLDANDRILFNLIARRTGHAMTRLRNQAFVESGRADKGALLTWRLSAKGEPVGGWRNGSGNPL